MENNIAKIEINCSSSENHIDENHQMNIENEIITDGNFLEIKIENDLRNEIRIKGSSDDISLDCSSNTSSQMDLSNRKTSEGTIVNDMESKYLEEQANLKKLLEESVEKFHKLEIIIVQKDDIIMKLEKDRQLLEKEKMMIKKENDLSIREKETAVIRYATLEKKLIDMKSLVDTAEKKYKDGQKEIELLNNKIKSVTAEKTRICNMLDAKCHELRNSQKDNEKYKNDLTSLEMKQKWNMVKLKQEMDQKMLAEKKIEELNQELNKIALTTKTENQVSEEQIMENQATLILLKHGNEEKEKKIEILENKISTIQNELTELNGKYFEFLKKNENLTEEFDNKQKENLELQNILDTEMLKVAELQSKVNELETLKTQLSIEKESSIRTKKELETLNQNYEEQNIELGKLRIKENELLQFNKELTERTVKLQNEISLNNSKSVALCLENENIKKDKKFYEDKIKDLEQQLSNEIQQRNDERIILTRHISEKTKLFENAQKKLENNLGDLDAIKKKHSQTIKELNRELTQVRRKIEQNEKNENQSSRKLSTDSSDNISTTGSIESNEINHKVPNQDDIVVVTPNIINNPEQSSLEISQNKTQEFPTIKIQEPSKKNLIERIVRLQHASARQNEKIDYLENQSANLAAELQKKQKLIQYYMLREQTGALASSKSDRNKAELAKYGGIMAAIYSGIKNNQTTDMTLDLSVEINRKLQAVLEDTLLKNITLKENLDTLGLEIDKLTRELSKSSMNSISPGSSNNK